MNNIERLMAFGLTRQEATLYLTLYAQGELSGYEAAKITGISRSNAYGALAGLVDKGAAYMIEGAVTKYIHVDINEFCNNKLKNLQEIKYKLTDNMPAQEHESEGYITINGQKHIIDKMKNLLMAAEQRIYLSISLNIVEMIREELNILIKKGIKIVLICDEDIHLPGVRVYVTNNSTNQLRMIVDSQHVLTGDIGEEESSCLYSSKKNLVDVFKDALRNEMKLIELTKGVIL